MFIDPAKISADALNALIKDYAARQAQTSDADFEITEKRVALFKQKLDTKEFVIQYSDNEDLDANERIGIFLTSELNLKPNQVRFAN